MCLSRPEAMLSICKIPLNECGISTVSAAEAQKSQIWAFVQSRLAAMRVDSCTNEFKQCLQSEDRCGPDYTQCVGLDREKVIALCPAQKLLTCPGKDSDYFDELVSGIMMGVDTGQLSVCQATVESKMEELCGGMAGCNQFENDANFGAESLAFDDMHTDRVSIKGLIDFSKLTISNNAVNVSDMNGSSAAASNAGLNYIANKINNVIGMLKADMTIRKCIEGSNMSQITRRGGTNTARFENLLDMPIANIINSGLSAARMNYNDKLEEMKVKAVAVIKGKLEKISEEQAEKMCYPAEQMPAAE
jgi:hypothetical protein